MTGSSLRVDPPIVIGVVGSRLDRKLINGVVDGGTGRNISVPSYELNRMSGGRGDGSSTTVRGGR